MLGEQVLPGPPRFGVLSLGQFDLAEAEPHFDAQGALLVGVEKCAIEPGRIVETAQLLVAAGDLQFDPLLLVGFRADLQRLGVEDQRLFIVGLPFRTFDVGVGSRRRGGKSIGSRRGSSAVCRARRAGRRAGPVAARFSGLRNEPRRIEVIVGELEIDVGDLLFAIGREQVLGLFAVDRLGLGEVAFSGVGERFAELGAAEPRALGELRLDLLEGGHRLVVFLVQIQGSPLQIAEVVGRGACFFGFHVDRRHRLGVFGVLHQLADPGGDQGGVGRRRAWCNRLVSPQGRGKQPRSQEKSEKSGRKHRTPPGFEDKRRRAPPMQV